MKQFSFLLLAFTLPIMAGMFIIQGAPDWWNLYILSEDMYDIIAQNANTFEALQIILIILFTSAFTITLFYGDKDRTKKNNDENNDKDNFPPQINPNHCF